ncbi:DegV family protein [Mycoplasma corogypsi]|uniref:DegV family protein n=1 Tax=Mycoplasma corogypsi TaxID=2106 RepID=UPI00387382C0
MNKIAIIVDSSSGWTQKEASELGLHFLPLIINVGDKKYQDGIDLDSDNLFKHFTLNSDNAKTAATPLGVAEDVIKKASEENDKVLIFPITKHLSSQCEMLKTISQNYPNVHVVDSVYIAALIPLMLFKFQAMLKQGAAFEDGLEVLNQWDKDFSVTLLPKYNDYLVKGGRLSPAAATIARLLKIVPLIKFEDGQLLKEGKGRIFLKSVFNVIDQKTENHEQYDYIILHSNPEELNQINDYLASKINKPHFTTNLPNVISIHTGPEAVVVIRAPKLTEEQKALFK